MNPFRAALERMPPRCRPALYFETFYNIGSGSFIAIFGLTLAALKSDAIFATPGDKEHLMLVAALFGGSSLLSPLVAYLGKKIRMPQLIVYPNLLAAVLLMSIGAIREPLFLASMVGLGFVIQVFPRVGEMNMFRVLYPPTHRGAAVGWVKAIASVSGLVTTVLGTFWFLFQPSLYYLAYAAIGIALATSAFCYQRIPVRRDNEFAESDIRNPGRVFWLGLKTFLSDSRFMTYQFGFWLAGFANHMAHAYVAESLKTDVHANDWAVFWVVAVFPALFVFASAPIWGRFLDRVNPMVGRALFNGIQALAYACYWMGGINQQVWPFVVGSIIQAIGNGGSTINWLTGSLYFASQDRVSLYNSIHVALTGIRGLIAPILGAFLYGGVLNLGVAQVTGLSLGASLFGLASGLSLLGALFMVWMNHFFKEGSGEEAT